jgi:hypothetical protein
MLKSQPIAHPIGRYYSSRSHPLPQEVEAYIDRLPLAQKMSLATALLNQCNTVFSNVPSLSVVRPIITEEDTSA